MREFRQGEIDQFTSFFTSRSFATERVMLLGRSFEYWVLPQSLNPGLVDFSLRATRTQEDGSVVGVFGVSGSVPPVLRPYWAAHEITEFIGLGIDYPNRCFRAERQVFEMVTDRFKGAYLRRRFSFFANLVDYFRASIDSGGTDYNEGDIAHVSETLQFLSAKRALGYENKPPLIEKLLDCANDYYQATRSYFASDGRRIAYTTAEAAYNAVSLEFARAGISSQDFFGELKTQTQDPLGEITLRENPDLRGMQYIGAASTLLASEMKRSNPDLRSEDERRFTYWTPARSVKYSKANAQQSQPLC